MVSKKILSLVLVGALGLGFAVNAGKEDTSKTPAALKGMEKFRELAGEVRGVVTALPAETASKLIAHPSLVTLTTFCSLVVFAEYTNHPFLSWVLAHPVEASVTYLGKPSVEAINWLWVRYNKHIIRNASITVAAGALGFWAIYAHKYPESKSNLVSDVKRFVERRRAAKAASTLEDESEKPVSVLVPVATEAAKTTEVTDAL